MADLQVADRLAQVRENITAACARAGRPEGSVQLVAVTKRIALPLVVQACTAGQTHFGENRIPDALDRQPQLKNLLIDAGLDGDLPVWHFIGHLQKNKANKAAGRFAMVHGVDSLELAQRLSRRCESDGTDQPILLEVNISGEAQKNGLPPERVIEVAAEVAALPHLELRGLMGMAARDASAGLLGETFAHLRHLCEDARSTIGLPLPELSMGMSGDYEVAIAEGATTVRVGGAIFGPRLP